MNKIKRPEDFKVGSIYQITDTEGSVIVKFVECLPSFFDDERDERTIAWFDVLLSNRFSHVAGDKNRYGMTINHIRSDKIIEIIL